MQAQSQINHQNKKVYEKGQSDDVKLVDNDLELYIIEDRNKQLKKINKDVIEVNQLFTDVMLLVKDQGEIIDNIEHQINKSVANSNIGVKELEKAEQNVQCMSPWKAALVTAGATFGSVLALAILI